VHDIDYDETFAPVVKMDSIRLTLSFVEAKGWEVHQMDMKNEFLHGDLCKEIYMEKPQGFMKDSSLVYRLKKSLYGLRQAPKAWYANMDSYLLSQNFVHCKSYLNVYMLRTVDPLLLLAFYFDDFLITSCSTSAIVVVKMILHDRFFMMNMGLLHLFLGIDISQDSFFGPQLIFVETLVMFDHFWDFDRLVEDGAPRQTGDREISPFLWDFWDLGFM
jgi:hypothetical protein